jgi:hypothetical protein
VWAVAGCGRWPGVGGGRVCAVAGRGRLPGSGASYSSGVGYRSGRAVLVSCRADDIRAAVASSLLSAGQPATGEGDAAVATEFGGWGVVR